MKRPRLGVWCLRLGFAGLLLSRYAEASPAPQAGGTASQADGAASAQVHFQNGIKLYQDRNYAGALAEFEAAYADKPGLSSLQNVALCLKALFRYAEAADVLRRALAAHGDALTAREQKDLHAAIDELAALVGTVHLRVVPASATVSIDGRLVEGPERDRGVALNVGEHTITAEAPGYAHLRRVLRLASQERQELQLTLVPTHGFLLIEPADAEAAVRIDGAVQSVGRFSGPVTPGRHRVRIESKGGAVDDRVVEVELGRTHRIVARSKGASTSTSAGVSGSNIDRPPPENAEDYDPRGFYGYLGLGVASMDVGTTELGAPEERTGGSLGLRGGYRIVPPLGIELLLEGANQTAKATCRKFGCGDEDRASYELTAARFGVGGRYMSSGRALRFTSTLGVGAVTHTFSITNTATSPELVEGERANAPAAYFLLEVGGQLNLGHLLLELAGVLFLDGVSNLKGSLRGTATDENNEIFNKKVLPFVGLSAKIGLSQWRPPRPSHPQK